MGPMSCGPARTCCSILVTELLGQVPPRAIGKMGQRMATVLSPICPVPPPPQHQRVWWGEAMVPPWLRDYMDKASSILFLPKEWVAFRDKDQETHSQGQILRARCTGPVCPPVAQVTSNPSLYSAGGLETSLGPPLPALPAVTCWATFSGLGYQ